MKQKSFTLTDAGKPLGILKSKAKNFGASLNSRVMYLPSVYTVSAVSYGKGQSILFGTEAHQQKTPTC